MKTKSLQILEKAQLPPNQARAILEVMEAELSTDILATKADLKSLEAATRADLDRLEASTNAEIKRHEASTNAEIKRFEAATQAEFKNLAVAMAAGFESDRTYTDKAVANAKYAMVRWMFVFWVGQLAAMFVLLKALK